MSGVGVLVGDLVAGRFLFGADAVLNVFGGGMSLDFRRVYSPVMLRMDRPNHIEPEVSIVLKGPMFTHGPGAKLPLQVDGGVVVKNVAVVGKVGCQQYGLLGLVKAGGVVNAYVTWAISANCHDRTRDFTASAATGLGSERGADVISVAT